MTTCTGLGWMSTCLLSPSATRRHFHSYQAQRPDELLEADTHCEAAEMEANAVTILADRGIENPYF